MTTPARDSGGHDLGAASDAATPGHTSVAAQFAADAAGLDTPGGATSPGEASPARHRSQEGRPAQDPAGLLHYNSRGRTSGHSGSDAAAARAASGAAAPDAALAAAEPLSKPRLRVQGADIILEDAASPRTTTNGGGATQQQLGEPPAAAAAGGAGPAAQQPALTAQQLEQREQQEQRQLLAQVVQASNQHQQQQHLAALARGSQSHEHELQLRLASRTGTGASNMAIAGSRQVPHADDSRLRGLHDAGGGGDALGGAAARAADDAAPVRLKYRSTLTEENVAYLNKLDQYASRPEAGSSAARSSERIWRWLEGSGPPFDSPPPSLGVPTVSKTQLAAASRRQGPKRSFLSCFGCFGGKAAAPAR